MDIKDLCTYLKISRTSIYRLLDAGLPHVRVGYVVRFRLVDVTKWLDEFTAAGRKLHWSDDFPEMEARTLRVPTAGPPPSRQRTPTADVPPSRRLAAKRKAVVQQPPTVVEPATLPGPVAPTPLWQPDPRRTKRRVNPEVRGESHVG